MHIATILTKTHSIIKKSMLIATDLLWVGFSSPKTFNLQSMPPTLSFCAEPNGEVAESIIPGITIVLRYRSDLLRRWVRFGEDSFFRHPSSALTRAPSSHGEGFLSLFEIVDSATPGKPCVQNDMRVRSGIGRRIHVLLVFTVEEYSRQDKSSFLLHV